MTVSQWIAANWEPIWILRGFEIFLGFQFLPELASVVIKWVIAAPVILFMKLSG